MSRHVVPSRREVLDRAREVSIRSRRGESAAEIARHLGVDQRTVERYRTRLTRNGFTDRRLTA